MGAVNLDNTGSGAAVTLSSNGTALLLNGTPIGGGGGGSSTLTIDNKTAAYTVVAGDLAKVINCTSGTFTVSLTAAATLGAGFNVTIWNTSTTASNVITIDPNGAETIDGRATLLLRCGEGMQIVCDGTNWQTGDKKTMRGYAENFTQGFSRPVASGDGATCVGPQTTASGGGSLAVGAFAQSSTEGSVAIGGNTVQGAGARATGIAAIAIGARSGGALASGGHAIAIGAASSTDATASSANSTAIGSNSGSTGSQAVTGAGAMALGGSYASGADSFAAAIASNSSSNGALGNNSIAMGSSARASSGNATAIGWAQIASGGQSVALGGNSSTASGLGAVTIGRINTSSGERSFTSGNNNLASQQYSWAVGNGARSVIVGKFAYTASTFSADGTQAGDSQYAYIVLQRSTVDATSVVLTSNGGSAGATNQVILPNNSAYAFSGIVVARQQASGGTQSAAWKVEGLIRREGTAASTTLVFSTVMAISNVPLWGLALSADTTSGGLAITATGAAATNIRWVAAIQTSEVTFA